MDPLLAANRLPRLAERSMRAAVLAALSRGRLTPRLLVDDALLRFEDAVGREAPNGIRPSLLFGERDRIVRELRNFIDGRLAARLWALHRRDVTSLGRAAAPFDLIVRNRQSGVYAVLFRRLPPDGRRLEMLRRIRAASRELNMPLSGILVYDFTSGAARLLLDDARSQRVDCHLRAS